MYEEIKLDKTKINPINKVLMKEELLASDGGRGPDPGGGSRSPNLVEDINLQHLVERKLTASGEK